MLSRELAEVLQQRQHRTDVGVEEKGAKRAQETAILLGRNADTKEHRGLDTFPARGLDKALGTACLFALTCNILRLIAMGG